MRVIHLLRKYNPDEWGGTETAVRRLLDGLRSHGVHSTVFCPQLETAPSQDPLRENGYCVKTFSACAPVWNITPAQRRLLVSVGGNLMSFDLLGKLMAERDLSLIHAHAGNRLGGIALTAAKLRKIPFVFTIHGGVLDLPESTRQFLSDPLKGGIEWGKLFGFLFGSRKVLEQADAILTCNKREAALQQQRFPEKRIIVQPHSVPSDMFKANRRDAARKAFPQMAGRKLLLAVGRIDPVKNQHWLVEQMPAVLQKFPDALLVLVGSCTDPGYGKMLESKVEQLGLGDNVLLAGSMLPNAPELLGLFQQAHVVLLPSKSETFGLVVLEAWAAGTPVLSSRTSGATDLIVQGESGMLFDLDDPASFHRGLSSLLEQPEFAARLAGAGHLLATTKYDVNVLGGEVKKLYEQLIEEKK